MSLRYDMYVRRNTWLHRLDARVKLLGTALAIAAALLINDLAWIFGYFLLLCVLMMLTKVTWNQLRPIVYTLMIPVTIMITILYPISSPPVGEVLAQFWIIVIAWSGIVTGLTMALRIDAMTLVSYTLLFTTTQRDLVRALVRFGLPYKYGLLIASAFRYLPAFDTLVGMIMDAQKARGLDLTRGKFVQKIRNYVPVLTSTMITSLRLADQLALALVSRGFGALPMRTYLTDIRIRRIDIVALVVLLVAFAFFIIIGSSLGVLARI